MKKQEKREWITNVLELDKLTKYDLLRLIKYDSKLLKYVDVNKVIDKIGVNDFVGDILTSHPKLLDRVNIYSNDIIFFVICEDKFSIDSFKNYLNKFALTLNDSHYTYLTSIASAYIKSKIEDLKLAKKKKINLDKVIYFMSEYQYNDFNIRYEDMVAVAKSNKKLPREFVKAAIRQIPDSKNKESLVYLFRESIQIDDLYELGIIK